MTRGKIKTTLFLCCLLAVFSPVAAHSFDEKAELADFEFARKAFNDGFYDLAQSRIENFLKSYPETEHIYDAYSLLGQCYMHQNMTARAQYQFQVILDTPAASRYYDTALYWTGEIALQEKDYKKSLEYYQKLIDGYPSSKYMSFAIYSQGWAYYKLGLLEEAAKRFGDVARRYPFEKIAAESQFRLAECKYLLGNYNEAEKELKKFTEKYPLSEKTQEAHYLAGEALFYQAKYKEAIGYFERALAISPDAKWASFALYRVAKANFEIGDYARSIAGYSKCLGMSTNSFINASCEAGIAQDYLRMGKFDDALKKCDETISKYYDSEAVTEAYYIKAKILYDKTSYKEAESLYKEAISKFPKSRLADDFHYELGWIYVMEARPDDAVSEFQWIENNSKDINLSAGALCKTGDIYLERQDYKRAVENYDLVLNKYSDSSWADYAQYQTGNVSFNGGKYDQAIIAYQTMLANYPNSTLRGKAMAQLGAAYFKKKDYEQAAAELERLLSEKTKDASAAQARLYLANAFFNLGRYKDALQIFRKVAESKESSSEDKMLAQYQIGWCYYHMSDEARAVDEFNRFLKDYSNSQLASDVRMWFGEHYASNGKYDKAREYYRLILTGSPSDAAAVEAIFRIASTLQAEGKPDLAIARYEEVISKYPNSDYAKSSYRKIANVFKDRKEFDRAVTYLKKVLTADNNELNAQIQYEIGECYEMKGELGQAVEEYLKVPYLYSKSPFWTVRAELRCAQGLERMDKLGEARKIYEKLAEMDVRESELAKKRLEWIKWRTAK